MWVFINPVTEYLSPRVHVMHHLIPIKILIILFPSEQALHVIILPAPVLVLPPARARVGITPQFVLLLLISRLPHIHPIQQVVLPGPSRLAEHVGARELLHGQPQLLEVHLALVELLQELPVEHGSQLVLLLGDLVRVADRERPLPEVGLLVSLPIVCLEILLGNVLLYLRVLGLIVD